MKTSRRTSDTTSSPSSSRMTRLGPNEFPHLGLLSSASEAADWSALTYVCGGCCVRYRSSVSLFVPRRCIFACDGVGESRRAPLPTRRHGDGRGNSRLPVGGRRRGRAGPTGRIELWFGRDQWRPGQVRRFLWSPSRDDIGANDNRPPDADDPFMDRFMREVRSNRGELTVELIKKRCLLL